MNNIKDIIYAYIVGDSYGLSLLKYEKTDNMYSLQDNLELNIEKGNYSQMTVFMLATLDSITKNKCVNTTDILNKMCTSLIVRKYTSDGKVYDLDETTLNILKHYIKKSNLNIEYNELDMTSYSLNRILPLALFNYYKEENLDDLSKLTLITNINDIVLLGNYIYYSYIINLLNGYDKYKSLSRIEIPRCFDKNIINKYKNILKGNLYYKEITKDNNIINVLSIVFYVILNSNNFKDIFMMLDNIEGNTNIYGSIICSIGGLLYGSKDIEKIIKEINNKKEINKYIKNFERVLKNG